MDLLEKMATFVRVVDAGSLSAAARQLRVSPAAVSRQIATLETELKTPLLVRSTRRMAITDAGRAYHERCVRILREVEDAQRIGNDGAEGRLRINAPVTFGTALVVPYLASFMRKYPRITVDLQLEDRLVDVVLEGVDVTIRAGASAPDNASLVAHPLITYSRALVAAPSYLKRAGTPKTPEALAKHATLGQTAAAWTFTRDGRDVRVAVDPVVTTSAFFAIRMLVLGGIGIAMPPRWIVKDDLASGALKRVLPEWKTPTTTGFAIHRVEQRGTRRVRAFIEHLRTVYAQIDA